MTETTLSYDLETARLMADAARAAISPHFRAGVSVDNKLSEGFDPVTAADKASERAMREVLKARSPEDGIHGEEYGREAGRSGRLWVLDPIDGTRAFISGLPSWTVLIALSEAGAPPHLGIIDQPHIGERFIGQPGRTDLTHGGAETQLRTRPGTALKDAILSTTDSFLFEGDEATAFHEIRQQVRLCRYGYDAYAYAMLATGGIDLVIESGLQAYDVQALIPVVEGAGGRLTNWRGGPAHEGGQVVAAASQALLEEALERLAGAAV